jgi:formylglycine-generating enzyme required for sulfatase activity
LFLFKNTLHLLIITVFFSCQLASRLKNLNKDTLPSIKNSISMELIKIPEGEFQMGCSNADSSCDEDETLAKKISIKRPFFIGKYEVTKGEFTKFISETGYKTDAQTLGFANTWKSCHGIKQKDDHPVICVSWNDAKEFTNWLSTKEKKKYRLPTEAEWEYAARASIALSVSTNLVDTRYYWGIDMNDDYAWYNKNSNKSTHPVGTKKPNGNGLYDMAGNASEWCEDDYDPDYFKKKEVNSPKTKEENNKVLRGGSWFDSYLMLRVSARTFAPKDARENYFGFRVVMEK